MKEEVVIVAEKAPVSEILNKLEAAAYRQALKIAKYNKSRAAKLLSVSRGTMHNKLNKYFPGEF